MVLINYHSQIIGDRVILVPYRPEHVATYHEWMKRPELLAATASEPLTMEEEIEMQQSWANDRDKCTFILVDKSLLTEASPNTPITTDNNGLGPISLEASVRCMCGDVNTFLTYVDSDDWYGVDDGVVTPTTTNRELIIGEMEVMIAEEKSRRKGIAQEAVTLLMNYVKRHLSVDHFQAKIGETNHASLSMFRQRLGFKDHRYYKVFEEYHLRYPNSEPLPSCELRIVDCPSELGW